MRWNRGDLGRFTAEHGKRPRFEVLGPSTDKTAIVVWYGGAPKPQAIPLATFKADCTNLWELQEAVPVLPPWCVEGGMFEFLPNTTHHVRQAEVIRDRGYDPHRLFGPRRQELEAIHTVNLEGAPVRIRRIRRDYTSCEVNGNIALIPLPVVVKFGIQRKSRWNRLGGDDLFADGDDPDEDLFQGFR